MVSAPKSAYFLLVSTTVGVKDLYPPAELMHRTGTLASFNSFLVSRPKRSECQECQALRLTLFSSFPFDNSFPFFLWATPS